MQTKDELAAALGISKAKLTYFAYALEDSAKYITFSISKRSGGSRNIEAPIPGLKKIQRAIAVLLKEVYIRHAPICNHGFGGERSIITNANGHLGKRYIVKCDIKNFYPSIEGRRVFGVLCSPPFSFSDEVSHIITKLCTFDGRLPQGAPTSPVLSNILTRKLDRKLMKFAQGLGGFYTRYADDITISFMSETRARKCIDIDASLSEGLRDIFRSEDFEINETKNRFLTKRNRQIVTGIVINEKLNVRREYIKELRNLLYILTRFGIVDAQKSLDKKNNGVRINCENHIEGKLRHLGRVRGFDDKVYTNLASSYAKYKPTFVATKKIEEEAGIKKCIIIAEGKTDYMHLSNALLYFNSKDMFSHMEIDLTPHENIEGWSDLDQHLTKSTSMTLGGLHIGIFDSDESKMNTKYSQRFHKLSKFLYAFRLPKPDFLDDDLFCIEMLYQKTDLLKEDSEGRRLYFTSEFDKSNYSHKSDPMIVVTNMSFQKLVVDTKVFRIVEGGRISVGLSKNDFARFVSALSNTFHSFNFDGFVPVFTVIQEICDDYYANM